ncbi:N-acetylmuramoyl-L-alanine amidase family protein [Cohnella luojiensis]|uniref:N-acetylmuramoyl-L-alanine amidase n=1 Tax=Cohnella luojiensis TaxID=652876 RepID=A0A4Y8M6W8_9BACL|nr:N-acetylmuramoyl-L-alanine amidase [Cohnella luojiensis]TFE30848.1 N-acetylmuramoyl-L-alanine amidase [Cohnella luojiensis]
MAKLIALCDGHGMETAGKRTPLLPNGVVMRENEFNRRVVALLDVHLKRCGFRTLLVAQTDVDTPLRARTDAANAAKADLYLSVHANAFGAGGLNSVRGIETFHRLGSVEGAKAAVTLHRSLLGGTKLPNRGVKTADFHVLRETRMPAVLVECGFMTNVEEAALLRSEAYRVECAEELARGVCEYFGLPFVREAKTNPVEPAVKMDPKDANHIIDSFVRPSRADALKKGDQAGAAEAHRLANELRKASGQPTQ